MMQNNLGLEAIRMTFFEKCVKTFYHCCSPLISWECLCSAMLQLRWCLGALTELTLESIEWLCCRPTDPIIRDGEDSSTSGAEPTTTSTTTTAEPVRQNGKNFIACRSMTGWFWLTLKILTYLRHTILNVALFRSHVYYILTSVTI